MASRNFWQRLFICLAATLLGLSSTKGDESTNLYALVLAPIDLEEATRQMTILDPNEDGEVDKEEQHRLKWKDEIPDFDLNKDNKITHLEIAIRHAKLRSDHRVEQIHVNNSKLFLRRHDKNRNGQLDPAEIANGWPTNPQEFDRNKDGVITLGEMAIQFSFMAGLRREMGIEQVDQVTAIRMVKKFDRNADKLLDEEERIGAPLPLKWQNFDKDGNKELGIEEIATMLAKFRRESGLSKSDLAKVRAIFTAMDPDKDGRIKREEWSNVLIPNLPVSSFEEFDSNKNDVLLLPEVQQVFVDARKAKGFNDDQLNEARRLLARHDKDKSTYIEAAELVSAASEGQLSKSILKPADADKDQRISLTELAKYLAKEQK